MTLHPEILTKNGKKQFGVLPYEEFVKLQEWLADMEDLLELRKAKRAEGKKRSISLREAKRRLGIA
jgi:PHD/YefM family antitoxin component YafN of YafNO toxin-antitoxin module